MAAVPCCTLIVGPVTVPWTLKANEALPGASLWMVTVPVKVPLVADWRRTRKTPLPPAGIEEGALMMRLKALPPATSAVGLLMLSVVLPVLVMVNCTEVGVPTGVEGG